MVVENVEEATRYYTEVLGFSVDEAEGVPGYYTQFHTEGDAIFALIGGFGDAPDLPQRFDTSIEVDDVDQVYADWKAKGADLLTEISDMPFGRTFLCRTPEGHVLRVLTMRSN